MASVSSQTPLLLSQTGLQLHHSLETSTQLLSLSFTPFTLALQTDSSLSFSNSLPIFPPQTLNPFWHLFSGGLGLIQETLRCQHLTWKEGRRWGAKRLKAERYFNTNSLIKCKIWEMQSFFFPSLYKLSFFFNFWEYNFHWNCEGKYSF